MKSPINLLLGATAATFATILILPDPARSETAQSERRTIDMSAELRDVHGQPMLDVTQASAADQSCQKCGHLTLGAVVVTALLSEHRDEQGLSAIEKARRGLLAQKIVEQKNVALTSRQVAEIIKLLNIWQPAVVARAVPLLDPNIDLADPQ